MAMRDRAVTEALKQEIGTLAGTLLRFHSFLDEEESEEQKAAAITQLNAAIQMKVPQARIVFTDVHTSAETPPSSAKK